MKNIFPIALMVVLLSSSCGSEDKKAKLDKLRLQLDAMQDEILKLEKEVALTDTSSSNDKSKVVQLITIAPSSFKHYVEVNGKVDSDNSINITAKMPGQAVRVRVKEGDRVFVGQVLFEQDSSIIVKGMEEVKNGLSFATQLYEKQKSLWDKKIGSEIQYLTAKNQKESLELRLASLKEQLEMTRITSPISGVVDQVFAKVGEMMAPGFPVARIINTSGFKVVVAVPENYAGKVKTGNEVQVSFPGTGREITSKIAYAGKVIDPMTRSFNIEIKVDNMGEDLKPNMVANVKLVDFSSESSVVIPVNTLQKSEDGDYVYTVEKGNDNAMIVRKKLVKMGVSYGGNTTIESGLTSGDQLVIFGYQGLSEGQKVIVNVQ